VCRAEESRNGPVVLSLGYSPSQQRLAGCRHDEVRSSYESDFLFVPVCIGLDC
jgi:hypothetical protein